MGVGFGRLWFEGVHWRLKSLRSEASVTMVQTQVWAIFLFVCKGKSDENQKLCRY